MSWSLRTPRASTSPRFLLVVGLGFVLLGCSESDPPVQEEPRTCLDPAAKSTEVPDFVLAYETEHLDIYLEEGRFLCAGSALDYDRFVSHVSEQTAVDLQHRIPLYIAKYVSEWCPTGAVGCTKPDGTVFSQAYAVYHEIVHAVVCEERSRAPAFVTEGLAVSFGPTKNSSFGDPTEFSEVPRGEFTPYYDRAGHFVRWLHGELGAEAFMDLYASATYETGIWLAVEAAYGASVEADYAATAPAMWVPHRQCADLPLLLEPTGGMWLYEGTLDCDDPGTLGPYERVSHIQAQSERVAMYQSFLIEIETPGSYRFEQPDFLEEGVTTILAERCLDEHPMTEEEIDTQWVKDLVWFNFQNVGIFEFEHAGLWRVDVLREHGPPVDTWLTIEPDPG